MRRWKFRGICKKNWRPGSRVARKASPWWSDWPTRKRPMKRGEVWRVRMPAVPGHTQAGERSAIIVQDESFNLLLPTVLIVPFTSTQRTTRFPGTLLVQPDQQNGLIMPSVALVFQ